MIGQPRAAGTHGHDLGMRTGIVRGDVEVPALAQQLAIGAHQYRTDRNLVELALRTLGQRQRMAHPVFIGVVHRYTQGIGHGGSRVSAGPGWPPGPHCTPAAVQAARVSAVPLRATGGPSSERAEVRLQASY